MVLTLENSPILRVSDTLNSSDLNNLRLLKSWGKIMGDTIERELIFRPKGIVREEGQEMIHVYILGKQKNDKRARNLDRGNSLFLLHSLSTYLKNTFNSEDKSIPIRETQNPSYHHLDFKLPEGKPIRLSIRQKT